MHSSNTKPAISLDEELKATRHLVQLLEQEQVQLIEADIERLTALIEQKTAAMTRMAELAKSRHRILAASGLVADDAGMQAWLDSTQDPNARKTWQELLALAQSAKETNRINGLLISSHLARNQAALNVVRGNTQSGGFYGPDGQPSTSNARRSLVVG